MAVPKSTQKALITKFNDSLTVAVDQVFNAQSSELFFNELKNTHRLIQKSLPDSPALTSALGTHYARLEHTPAKQISLLAASAALFDKPLLPEGSWTDNHPEFMWSLLLPLVVTFEVPDDEQLEFQIEPEYLDHDALAELFKAVDFINPLASPRLYSGMYRREDFLKWGPIDFATHLIKSEILEEGLPMPSAMTLSGRFPHFKSVPLYVVMPCRMPVGQQHLVTQDYSAQFQTKFVQLYQDSLIAQGLPVSEITLLKPMALGEAVLFCNPAQLYALECGLAKAHKEIGITEFKIRKPMPGFVEVVAKTKAGRLIPILPAHLCVDPRDMLEGCVEKMAQRLNLPLGKLQKNPFEVRSGLLH